MHDSIGLRREPAAQCGTAARQPQIVDMQHRDPIRPSLLDAETSLGYPRVEIRPPMDGKRQPSGEALGDLHAGFGIAAVNEDDLDPGFMLLDDGLQRLSKPALAVPARHDDRKPGVCHCPDASPIYCESWLYGLIMTPCPVGNDNTLAFPNSDRSASASLCRHLDVASIARLGSFGYNETGARRFYQRECQEIWGVRRGRYDRPGRFRLGDRGWAWCCSWSKRARTAGRAVSR